VSPAGRRAFGRLACALAVAQLLGCATTPPPSEPANLSGRLSVRVAAQGDTPGRSVSAVFDLRSSDGQSGELDLSTPLGTLMGRARWSPGQVSLATSQGERSYPSLAALSEDVLGEDVPVQALFDWLQGRAWPGAASTPLTAPSLGFSQLGWTIRLDRLADGAIQAERAEPPEVTVQVRLQR
jgi:outer membrane lipoprotein LolB